MCYREVHYFKSFVKFFPFISYTKRNNEFIKNVRFNI